MNTAGIEPIQIYYAPHTRAIRVLWLCEELGLPYERIDVDFSAEYRASPEWRSISPAGKVPIMRDGEVQIFESGAMVQYLLDRYGQGALQPTPGTPDHALYLQWSWFGEATLARPLGEIINHGREFPGDREIPEVVAEMRSRAQLFIDVVAAATQGGRWLVADRFTAADIMVGYSLGLARLLMPEALEGAIAPYWDRTQSRDAFQRAQG